LAALTKLVLFFLLALNPIPLSSFSAPLSDIEILVEREYSCAPLRPSKLPFQIILAIYYWVAVLTLLDLPPVDAWAPSKNSLLYLLKLAMPTVKYIFLMLQSKVLRNNKDLMESCTSYGIVRVILKKKRVK
jgi:hypothetical protein